MPIKLLQREISKPLEIKGPINTGGFYNLKHRSLLTETEKRFLQALFRFNLRCQENHIKQGTERVG